VELIGVLPDDLTQNTFASPCPVPPEQLPVNEYQELQESWFFRWATLETPLYISKLSWIGFWSWAIASPVVAASFPLEKYFPQFVLVTTAGAILLLSLILVRLYLGWNYISSRLMDARVVYEESGWYDGQVWEKPTEVLTRDRLVATYQIHPLLKRMRNTFAILATVLVVEAITWYFWL
jgi:hypothetical protein